MMRIAPRSSRIASVSRKIFSADGTRLPRSARTPTAKAMSVAAGMAQPPFVTGSDQLKSRKISAGTAMPPTAAMPGNITSRGFFSLPSIISRFSSSPMRKKKIAIKPSLIHRISSFDSPSPSRRMENFLTRTDWYRSDRLELAMRRARTAAAIKTIPPAASWRKKRSRARPNVISNSRLFSLSLGLKWGQGAGSQPRVGRFRP